VCVGAGWSLLDLASACLDGGAVVLQVRAKQAAAGWLLDCTQRIVERAAACRAQVIVNDRADIAVLAGAAGVHVGQDDPLPAAVRSVAGDTLVVGLSTHTADQLERAMVERIDYVAVGPVFATATKDTGYNSVGLTGIAAAARVASSAGVPLVAIGGITLESAPSVLDAGANAVAVISDLLAGGDPASRVREYLRHLNR
jgi:thiamine-phosphate pyrophosphorylase